MENKIIREKKHRLERYCYKGFVRATFTLCINDRKKFFIKENENIIKEFIKTLKEETIKQKAIILNPQ